MRGRLRGMARSPFYAAPTPLHPTACTAWRAATQGLSGFVAVYNLQSNARLGRVDIKALPVEMAFAPDGSSLVVVTQVPGGGGGRVRVLWHIHSRREHPAGLEDRQCSDLQWHFKIRHAPADPCRHEHDMTMRS